MNIGFNLAREDKTRTALSPRERSYNDFPLIIPFSVHEGLEEAEDEPAVDHLDVGGGGKVGAHTELELELEF